MGAFRVISSIGFQPPSWLRPEVHRCGGEDDAMVLVEAVDRREHAHRGDLVALASLIASGALADAIQYADCKDRFLKHGSR